MPKLQIAGFDGLVPRTSPTMLAENQATVAENVKLYAGELRTWSGSEKKLTPAISDLKSIYALYYGQASLHNNIWLTWDTDVDVAPGPSADVTDVRVYYTGDGYPKKTNWALATSAGSGAYPRQSMRIGVPAPMDAPTVQLIKADESPIENTISTYTRMNDGLTIDFYDAETATTTTTTVAMSQATASDDYQYTTMPSLETRAYVYTYISTFGSLSEESAPSEASSLVEVATGDKVRVSGFSAAPTSGYNITAIRIYRTIAGEQSGGGYVFVSEIPLTTTEYEDALTATELGEALATIGWLPPQDNMVGITSMPNGVLAGFVGNTVYFCEPYFPHAWPTKYSLTVPHNIVGLAAYGNSLIVMTDLFPYAINGVTPGSMTVEKIPLPEPCVSKRSIAVDQYGVVYASPNGLVGISSETRAIISTKLFRREEWLQYQPEMLIGAIYGGKYFGFFQSSIHGSKALVLSRDDIPALSYISVNAAACHTDVRDARLFYVAFDTNDIYQLDSDALNPSIYEWQSKRFVFPKAVTFSAFKVDVDVDDILDTSLYIGQTEEAIAHNKTLFGNDLKGALNADVLNAHDVDGSILTNLPHAASSKWVKVFVYADRKEVCAITITAFDPVRLPPFKCRELEVKLTGNTSVRSITFATSVPELHA